MGHHVYTFTPPYRSLSLQTAGAVAAKGESLKGEKYSVLFYTHEFVPVGMESSGVFGPQSMAFVKESRRKLRY